MLKNPTNLNGPNWYYLDIIIIDEKFLVIKDMIWYDMILINYFRSGIPDYFQLLPMVPSNICSFWILLILLRNLSGLEFGINDLNQRQSTLDCRYLTLLNYLTIFWPRSLIFLDIKHLIVYLFHSQTIKCPDRKELIKIISTRYLLISLITRKYLVDMILINLSGRGQIRS
jgi:hypothetical protein